jgi:hypothetical protein
MMMIMMMIIIIIIITTTMLDATKTLKLLSINLEIFAVALFEVFD